MIRDRLKQLDIKITELSDYLQLSRPTMYKFIEDYDNGNTTQINKKVLKLFKYIETNELVGKNSTINYILTNLTDLQQLGEKEDNTNFNKIKRFINDNPDSNKKKFIDMIVHKKTYDNIIDYLIKIHPLIKKRDLNEEEIKILKPFDEINEIMENTTKEEN